jgi:hypothetical protein
MIYRIPFKQIREGLLAVSVAQLARVLGVDPESIIAFEQGKAELSEHAQDLADCLHDAANAAISGDGRARMELERIGQAMRSMDDIEEDEREKLRLETLGHIRALGDTDREPGRSIAKTTDELTDLRSSKDYDLEHCQDYERPLQQLIAGGPSLRRQVSEALGKGAPRYMAFHLWGGMEGAEKRSPLHAACTLIRASGWGIQARGNTWRESLNPFDNNVPYRDLLVRCVHHFNSQAAPDDAVPLPKLERMVAEGFAGKFMKDFEEDLKEQGKSELLGPITEAAADVETPELQKRSEWADMPLAPDSPLRKLTLVKYADWASRHGGKKLKDLAVLLPVPTLVKFLKTPAGKSLAVLIRTHPAVTVVVALLLVGTGVAVFAALQELDRVGAALTLIHLSELGLLPVEPT